MNVKPGLFACTIDCSCTVVRSLFRIRTGLKFICVLLAGCQLSCVAKYPVALQCEPVKASARPFLQVTSQDLMASLLDSPRSNQARADRLLQRFGEVGCDQANTSAIVGSRYRNVVCRLAGTSKLTLVVGAHYDKTSKGQGVADNWTGVSLLPYLYAEIARQGPRHSFVFVGFAEEETTLAGSTQYVNDLPPEELDATVAMLNLDTLGLAPVQADPRSAPLLREKLGCLANRTGLAVAPGILNRWLSGDWEPFRKAGIPVLSLHSLSRDRSRLIHSESDSIDIVNPAHYTSSFLLIRQLLVELDTTLDQ